MKHKVNWLSILLPLLSILMAFIVGSLIILGEGKNPIMAFVYLFKGALGSTVAIGETLAKTTALIFTGLTATFAYRCGMFNLGGEGQLVMGAVAACAISTVLPESMGLGATVICLVLGMCAGALWGAIPGWLRAYRQVNEMITSILLNYIAILFMEYLFSGPLKEANIPQTAAVPASMRLPIFIPDTRGHIGIFFAILAAVLVWYFLFRTYRGFSLRAIGMNPSAARVNGFDVKRMLVFSMVIAGCIAGIGGAVEFTGISYRLQPGFAAGFGFDGVAIALIGQLHPIGVVLVAFLFAALKCGTNTMQIMTGISTSIVDIIQAIIIIFAIAATAVVRLPRLKHVFSGVSKTKEG